MKKENAEPYAVKCQDCGLIFGHRDLWAALQYGASSKAVCPKCAATGPFIVPSGSSARLFGQSGKSLDWNSRTKVTSVAVATVLIFVVVAVWWTDFLYTDACLDAGGKIEAERCVGARHSVPALWQTPWPNIALGLLPPTIGAIIFAMVAWRASRVGNGDA